MSFEKIKGIGLYGLGVIVALGFVWLILKFVLPIILPFILAYALSYALRFVAAKLKKLTRMNENVLRGLLLAVGVAAIGAFLWFAGAAIVREMRDALTALSENLGGGGLPEKLITIMTDLGRRFGLDGELGGAAENFLSEAGSKISALLAQSAGVFVSSLPKTVFGSVIFAIALFYFTFGYERSASAIKALLPEKHRETVCSAARSAVRGLGKFARTYCTLMAITAAELFIGFLILKVDHALILAIFVSVIDILPVLGVGTVLVPWALISLLLGNTGRAVGLLILMAVIWLVRQPLESRLVGKSAGVHPIIALIAAYAGYRLAGVFGMLIAPTVLNVVNEVKENRRTGE